MSYVFDLLVNAVNTATNPEAREAAAKELASAVLGGGIFGTIGTGGPGSSPKLGPIELGAIGQLQRTLADIASGVLPPLPISTLSNIAQLLSQAGGAGVPGWPPTPFAGLPVPGLPFQIPQIPGLDPCKFIKCLAASMDCDCNQTGSATPDKNNNDKTDPIGNMINGGIDVFRRARDMTEEKLRQADQTAKDLAAAVKSATGAAKAEIEAARKVAEANANELRGKSADLAKTIGSALAQVWPPR